MFVFLGGHSVLFVRMPKILVREHSWEHSQERSRNVRWSVFFAAFGTSLSANAECSCLRAFAKPFARTLPNRTRTFWQSIFSASFGSDRQSCGRANTSISHSALLECCFYFYWVWRHNANGVTHAEREVVVAAVTRKLSKLLNTVIQ